MAADFAILVYFAGIATGAAVCSVIAWAVSRRTPADCGKSRQIEDDRDPADFWKRGEAPPTWTAEE